MSDEAEEWLIRRVPEITAEQENLRMEPVAGLAAVTMRRDPVQPVPIGTCVAMVFQVTGYDRDCDGSLMARLDNVGADGESTGWEPTRLGLHPGSTWIVDGPDALDRVLAMAKRPD